jgi:hypothetical protein
MLHDEDVLLSTLRSDGSVVIVFTVRPWSDEEIGEARKNVQAAFRNQGPDTTQGQDILAKMGYDDRVVLAALQQDGLALKFVPEEGKNDQQIVIAAVQ